MFRLIRSFDTGHGNPIGAACFTSPVENNHNELRATGDRETVLGSRLYREERAMPQSHQLFAALPPLSGYITPIACKFCSAKAHLIQFSTHPELNAELRTFECEQCGKQTDMIVLRE